MAPHQNWIETFPDWLRWSKICAISSLREAGSSVLPPAAAYSAPARRRIAFSSCWTAASGCSRFPESGREIALYRVHAGENGPRFCWLCF
jgi:hypothetical protein